ncbi:MAG TPA: tyrosine-type recombinase/integrase [Amycolatopsis sp.]|uniref:site-specific integrase n=1 Tax=Amycolatopsis sp. TaxID=37632 RepID=UPI002B47A013|nr:tyrosine-type recombinase/integrase [Amycolatopsis sp.]HKS47407.1 tyrosine-type recombinase/integrase [Amycolatopsis sp.]
MGSNDRGREIDRRALKLAPGKHNGLTKRCGCTEIGADGKRRELGMTCQKLVKLQFDGAGNLKVDEKGRALWDFDSKHGGWGFQIDIAAPRGSGKERQRLRKFGFKTLTEAKNARAQIEAKGTSAKTRRVGLTSLTTEDALTQWLKTRKVRKNTLVSYTGHVDNYLIPYLGKIKWRELSVDDVAEMFRSIEDENERIRESLKVNPRGMRHSNLTKAQKAAGVKREQRRVAGPPTLARIRATGRKAYNDAMRAGAVSGPNPFALVELESGAAPKPKLWTKELEAKWRKTGEVPQRNMVWTAAHTGHYLDVVAEEVAAGREEEVLYDLFDLASYTGLRRGELCGLRWSEDVNLDEGCLDVQIQLVVIEGKVEEGPVKSDAGQRRIPLDSETVAGLRRLRKCQSEARLGLGTAWVDSGRVFCRADGSQLNPDRVYDAHVRMVKKADLPPVTIHGLRRGAGSIAIASGQSVKGVSAMLGHAREGVTEDHYVVVADEMTREIVTATRSAIPRKGTGQAV